METFTKIPALWYNRLFQKNNENMSFCGMTLETMEKFDACNFKELSLNPNLTPDFIERNISQNWDWEILSASSCITSELVKKYPKKPWNLFELVKNIFVNKTDLVGTIMEINREKLWRTGITQNDINNWNARYLPIREILNNFPELLGNLYFPLNPEFSLEVLEYILSKTPIEKKPLINVAAMFVITSNRFAELNLIEHYIQDFPKSSIFFELSKNYNMTKEFMSKYSDKPWDWTQVRIKKNKFPF